MSGPIRQAMGDTNRKSPTRVGQEETKMTIMMEPRGPTRNELTTTSGLAITHCQIWQLASTIEQHITS